MRLHLIDGTYELFRAHFSKRPPRTGPDGNDIKATTGVIDSLLYLLHDADEAVTHIAVAYDNPIESFRNELFDGYKDSSAMPPELLAQFDAVEEATRAIGVTVWSMNEWEADDALGAGAVRFRDEVEQVRIMTPDKDMGQCIDGTRVVQVDRRTGNVRDEAALLAEKGIAPASVPDWLALVGDSADGYPGIPGFGERSASAVLARYPHIEDIPALALHWDGVDVRGATRLAATLAERLEEALLYRHLARLVTDVPLTEVLDDLEFVGVPRDDFLAWCDQLGLEGMRERPQRWS